MSNSAADKHTEERDTRGARYDHLWLGEVVANDDPLNLGRVQVFVDGIFEPDSNWAFPMGFMHGVKEGVWAVPRVGAQVVVFLNNGDVDHPYYMPGPFGAPGGESDVPDQASSTDHYVLRWRGFHCVINGKAGEEKLFVKDEVSGTMLEIDRVNGPGDYTRDVEGNETVNVALDRNVTVETGNEVHTVATGNHTKVVAAGDDTETIGGNKVKTVTGGEVDTINGAAGKVETVTGVGGSTETVAAGPKTITAGLAVTVTAGLAMTLNSGGVLSILGAGVTINSAGGPTNVTSGGLATKTFLGAVNETITGLLTQNLLGAGTLNVTGLYQVIASAIQLGLTANLKKLVHEDFFANAYNAHTHAVGAAPGTTGPPDQLVVPSAAGPDVDLDTVSTQNVTAS